MVLKREKREIASRGRPASVPPMPLYPIRSGYAVGFPSLRGLGRLLVVLCLVRLATCLSVAAPVEPAPDILVINSYAPGYPWSEDELKGMTLVLRKAFPEIEPVIEYLDFKRFPDPEREAALLTDVVGKCRVRPPKVIVTVDDPAFEFAVKYREQLGGEAVPLVFGGLNYVDAERLAGVRNCTGVAEESDFSGTFQLIEALMPRTRRILVISNPATSAQASLRSFRKQVPAYADRYEFEYFTDWTSEELIARVADLPEGTVGLILDVTRDVTGKNNYNSGAFSEALAARASQPVFISSRPPGEVDWAIHSWDGIGGGLVVAELHGEKLANSSERCCEGNRPHRFRWWNFPRSGSR